MRLHQLIVMGVFCGLLLGSAPVRADDWKLCLGSDIASKIVGCTKIIKDGKQSTDNKEAALVDRGIAYANKGDFDSAIADYDKALELKPDDADVFYNRGNSHEKKGEIDKAIADYDKAIELKPDDGYAFYNRGFAYENKGDFDSAIANFDKALELKPDDGDAFGNRGLAYANKGDFDRAIADYNKAVEIYPDYEAAFFNRGLAYENKGDFDRAIADLDKALELKPGDAFVLKGRADTYKKMNRLDEAIADYEKALRLNPSLGHTDLDAARSEKATQVAAANTPAAGQPSVTPPIAVATKAADGAASLVGGRRVALVIGNSSYRAVTELANPARDADLVGDALRKAGVDVTVTHDLDRSGMIAALNSFANKADNADWAVVYFAGHGIEMDGHNYLIPVDATLTSDRSVVDETISLDRLMSSLQGARQLKLVVLDACRNNPFHPKITAASRSIDRGLSRVEPDDATLVVYAAKEGTVAADGEGTDSPFAVSFAKRIDEPGVEINMALRFVRQDVLEATGRQQEPFVYGSLPPTDFFFVPAQ